MHVYPKHTFIFVSNHNYRKMLESVGQDYANDITRAKQQRKCTVAPKSKRRAGRRSNFYPFLVHFASSSSMLSKSIVQVLSRCYADRANRTNHVASSICTNSGTSKPSAAHDGCQVNTRALGSRTGCELFCLRAEGRLRACREHRVGSDSELNSASAPGICLLCSCSQAVPCAWAQCQRLGDRGCLTRECRSEACNSRVVLSDGINRNGRVELADEPALNAVAGLDV